MPRTVKAFVNRLRYMVTRGEFSKLSNESVNTINTNRKAHLVAIAAIYYCNESDIDNVLGNLEAYIAAETRPSKTRFDKQWPDLAKAIDEHFQSFGAYLSQQDFDFYQAMNADICIYRQD